MVRSPDAFCLLMMLQRHHWGRDFAFANAMSDTMNWSLRRFVAVRKALIEMGIVTVIRRETRHKPMFCRLSAKALWNNNTNKQDT
jgi:hypothetical protein